MCYQKYWRAGNITIHVPLIWNPHFSHFRPHFCYETAKISQKSQDFLKKRKKYCGTLDGFNEIQQMVSKVSKKRLFFLNVLVNRAKIRPIWSNFPAIYYCIFQKRLIFWNPRVVQNHNGVTKIEQNVLKNSVFWKKIDQGGQFFSPKTWYFS